MLPLSRIVIVKIVFSIFALHTLVYGEVFLQSTSLTSTGRQHPCPRELLVFTCQTSGTYLDWKFDTVYRAIFFDDQPVDQQVQTVSGQGFQMRSILTGNEALTGMSGKRRLNSILIIQLSESNTEYHNITCSSDTDTQVVRFQTAVVPNVPRNIQVFPFNSSQDSQYPVTLRWEEPDNIHGFDLDHYKIQLSSQSQDMIQEYTLNVTSPKLEYPFGLLLNSQSESVNISVSAVSKCSWEGPASTPHMVIGRGPVQAATDSQPISDLNISGFQEVQLSSMILNVAVGLIMALYLQCNLT